MANQQRRKFCAYPFRQMKFGPDRFVPCCENWLEPQYRSLDQKSENLWNSDAAQDFRRKMLEGDLSWCSHQTCRAPLYSLDDLRDPKLRKREGITDTNFEAMLKGQVALPDGPSNAVVMADSRCNLKCRACRKDFVFQITPEAAERMELTDKLLTRHRDSITHLRLTTDGEVFFSPWLRELLKTATPERFPMLQKIQITSNGLLFDQRALDDLRPGSDLIDSVSISIDAGTENVYNSVRGGDWSRLMKNLEWLSGLRKQKRISFFEISFVVGLRNFMTMPEFVDLGEKLGVDQIIFSQVMPDKGFVTENSSEFVCHPEHPLHAQLAEICHEIEHRPGVRFSFPY